MHTTLHLFDGYGIELEYMIVDAESLEVRPIADELLKTAAGADSYVCDVDRGPIAWSNELVSHVVEFKTNGPVPALNGLADQFHADVLHANALLDPGGARLHPAMIPDRDMRLWPHDYSEVYQAYHKVFNCKGHGWANLQSMHINLPFSGDEEFGRLHAAIRLVLPLLPALAASSPLLEGKPTGKLDTRLDAYRTNAREIASVAGRVIPERCFSEADYHEQILQPMYTEIAPFDPGGVLQEEFLNSRGAIARFSRGAIEIRLVDVQECPRADVAVAAMICRVVKRLVEETWCELSTQQAIEIEPLEAMLLTCITDADQAVVDQPLLGCFGIDEPITAGELWMELFVTEAQSDPNFLNRFGGPLRNIFDHGPLARRIMRSLDDDFRAESIREVYGSLCDCLAGNRMFG